MWNSYQQTKSTEAGSHAMALTGKEDGSVCDFLKRVDLFRVLFQFLDAKTDSVSSFIRKQKLNWSWFSVLTRVVLDSLLVSSHPFGRLVGLSIRKKETHWCYKFFERRKCVSISWSVFVRVFAIKLVLHSITETQTVLFHSVCVFRKVMNRIQFLH